MCSLQWSARGAIQVLDSCANTTMIYVDVSTVGRTLEGLSCSTNTPGFTSPRSAYWFCFRKPITKFSALECNMSTGYWVPFAVIKLTCCSIPYYLGTYCFLSLTQNRCSIYLHRRPMISHETDLIRLHEQKPNKRYICFILTLTSHFFHFCLESCEVDLNKWI